MPDGYGSIPKAERIGLPRADDLPEIVEHEAAVDLARQQAEWDAAVPSAIAAREQEGPITKFMNWDVYIESWGERPEVDKDASTRCQRRRGEIEQAEQQADRARDVAIIAGMQSYDGPLNRRGKPRMRPLRQHLEEYDLGYITRAERNELWAKV